MNDIRKLFSKALLAVVAIPLSSSKGWQDLKYSKIKPNQVTYASGGMTVKVENSASPLVYPLPAVKLITGFSFEVEVQGQLNTTGEKFPEDAYFRLGLVSPGQRKLGWMERKLAADWVKTLFSLAPKDTGIDRIYFYNFVDQAAHAGQSRVHPKSKDLIHETVIMAREKGQNKFSIQHTLAKPLPAAAVWLSIDGDDTKSAFTVTLKRLELEER